MMKLTINYMICCILLLTAGGCKHPDITLHNPNDLLRPAAEFAHNNFEFSLFYAAIERAGLIEELNGRDPITVFAPNNRAFNEIGIQSPSDFSRMDKESLKYLVRTHVINQKLYAEDVPVPSLDNRFMSAAGTELWLARYSIYNGLYINGAISTTNRTNIRLSNGLFHEIDKVLDYNNASVQIWLEKQKHYSILIAGLKKFGLWDQLAGKGQFTIMAPRDEVFEAKGITRETIEAMNVSRYGKRLFGAYLFSVRFFTTDLNFFLYSGSYDTEFTKGGARIRLPINGDPDYSNGISEWSFFVISTLPLNGNAALKVIPNAAISSPKTDHLSLNGIVHEINNILFLPEETLIN
jgi:uncharacterized surface protein with fasciclin (FAS1) repeats